MKTALAAAVTLLAVLCARPAAAQRELYGLGGSAAEARRQFESEAREQVSALLAGYRRAWEGDDAAALTALYHADAVFYPAEGGHVQGPDNVLDYFARLLPRVERLRTEVLEFHVSGDMAYLTVQVVYDVRAAGGVRRSFLGTDLMVLRKEWAEPWTIVSHFAKSEGVTAPAPPERGAGTTPE